MIHIILGTKAQLIKMAPIMKRLHDQGIEYNYISTGQHRATIDDILKNFNIKQPDHVLYDRKDITSVVSMFFWSIRILFKAIINKKKIFRNDKNGIVLVHGDTFSTVLGAMIGRIAGLKVGHVESGLRSFNIWQPFPEEISRLLTFRMSHFMFCPGQWAVDNLKKYRGKKINTEINTLYDSLNHALPAIEKENVDIPEEPYGIVTLHRFENLRNYSDLKKSIDLVVEISKIKKILFILHKPTEKKLKQFDLLRILEKAPNIELRQRYDYFKFIKLIIHADLVISDGGSNQEECYYLGKPVLLFRNVSERNEGIGLNAVISKFDKETILNFVENYKDFTKSPLKVENKPSDIIIDSCKTFIE